MRDTNLSSMRPSILLLSCLVTASSLPASPISRSFNPTSPFFPGASIHCRVNPTSQSLSNPTSQSLSNLTSQSLNNLTDTLFYSYINNG